MKTLWTLGMLASAGLAAVGGPAAAQAQRMSDNIIRIGVINDRSGAYSDLSGEGSAIAARMAVEEFGGKINGVPIEVVTADHQNKADVGNAIARKWLDSDGVDVIVDVSHSGIALAINAMVKERKKIVLINAGANDLSGKACTPRSVQWLYNAYSTAANVVSQQDIKNGLDSFFLITVDYAFGNNTANVFRSVVTKMGGKIVGELKHPLNTSDFSSFLLQAQSSGAKAVVLANNGSDLVNASKQSVELGISPKQQLLSSVIMSTEIESSGLQVLQGLRGISMYEWNLNDRSRAWMRAYQAKSGGKVPSAVHASTYSQVRHYLNAVRAAGSDDADTVMAQMRKTPISDAFTPAGKIREDGLMVHDLYLVRVKKPAESTGKGDYTHMLQVIPAESAFQPLSESDCPLVKK